MSRLCINNWSYYYLKSVFQTIAILLVLVYWQLDFPVGRECANQLNQIPSSVQQGSDLQSLCVGVVWNVLWKGLNF